MTDVIALEKLAVGCYPSKTDSFKPHRSVLIRGGSVTPMLWVQRKVKFFHLKYEKTNGNICSFKLSVSFNLEFSFALHLS